MDGGASLSLTGSLHMWVLTFKTSNQRPISRSHYTSVITNTGSAGNREITTGLQGSRLWYTQAVGWVACIGSCAAPCRSCVNVCRCVGEADLEFFQQHAEQGNSPPAAGYGPWEVMLARTFDNALHYKAWRRTLPVRLSQAAEERCRGIARAYPHLATDLHNTY